MASNSSLTQKLRICFQTTLSCFSSAAILDQQGQLLYCKKTNAEDLGVFVTLFKTTQKYFNLGHGDMIICNDPSAGGACPCQLSVLCCVHIAGVPYYLISIINISNSEQCWSEILKIPPTPIANAGQLNQMILQAIQSHPQCSKDMAEKMNHGLSMVLTQTQRLQKFVTLNKELISVASLKQYLQASEKIFNEFLNEYEGFEQYIECNTCPGQNEKIKLKTQITNQNLLFDFSGTTPSTNRENCGGLPSHFILGLCASTILNKWELQDFCNQGIMSKIHITTPKGCLLDEKNAKNIEVGEKILSPLLNLLLSTVFEHPRASKPV